MNAQGSVISPPRSIAPLAVFCLSNELNVEAMKLEVSSIERTDSIPLLSPRLSRLASCRACVYVSRISRTNARTATHCHFGRVEHHRCASPISTCSLPSRLKMQQQQAATRPPPNYDSASPPPYSARLISRAYTRDLRPVVLIVSFIGLAWSLWSGIAYLQSTGSTGETAKLKTFDIIVGALILALAGVEAFGIVAVWLNKLRGLQAYAWIAGIGAFVVLGIEILRVVLHFVLKDDIISQCAAYYSPDFDGTTGSLGTANDLQNYCQTSWKRNIFIDIAWLVLTVVVGFFQAALASALYVRSIVVTHSDIDSIKREIRVVRALKHRPTPIASTLIATKPSIRRLPSHRLSTRVRKTSPTIRRTRDLTMFTRRPRRVARIKLARI